MEQPKTREPDTTSQTHIVPVAWRERQTLEGVTSEEVQLRFTLYGKVRLYSFTFTS